MRDKKPGKSGKSRPLLDRINRRAAGIDCGATMHYVAVGHEVDPEPVRCFSTFTDGLNRLADWLMACGIETVAMEATGVYWIAIYEILEARGLEVLLVNARHVKNVPGRKSDVSDCEWLQELHSVGLLKGSFRPAAQVAVLRSYLRHRETLVREAATAINRMQKALVEMNLHLHVVLSDITGETGQRIVRDIVRGQRDPRRLAMHRDGRCKASEEEIAGALTGNYRPEHLFVLQQNLELYDFVQAHLAACDREIELHLTTLAALSAPPVRSPLPPARSRSRRGNTPPFDVRTALHQITGIDITQIDGIGPYAALRVIGEIGTDMSRWPTQGHFTSWLTLAPSNRVSGGRLLRSGTQPSANRAAVVFRMAVMSLSRTQTALGAFYRRLAYRIGKAKAITATARKLAILVYRCLKGEIVYKDPGAAAYDRARQAAVLRSLRDRAANLGYTLLNQETGEILEGGVS